MDLTREELERIAAGAAEVAAVRAVEGVLIKLGIDTSNPIAAQGDFAKLRALRKMMEKDEFIEQLVFLRKLHTAVKVVETTTFKYATMTVLGLLFALLGLGLKGYFHNGT